MTSSGAFTPEARAAIVARANGRCEICGISLLLMAYEIHHRRPRGMGGSKRASTRNAANGLMLHTACHLTAEKYRSVSYEHGWLVRQAFEPSGVPVKMHDGWWLLGTEGERLLVKLDG